MNAWLYVTHLASAVDPLAGVVVGGSAGLLAWLSLAALVGVALGWLRRRTSESGMAEAGGLPWDEDHRDAA